MAVFSQLSAGDISSIDDMQKVRDYLYKLNKNLRYMFNNLTPEDNYSEMARLTMVTDGQRQATIEASLEGISLNYVSKDNIVSSINLSEEMVQIAADKIRLEGVVTVNGNFKVGLDGSIEANNGKFKGSISGTDISLGGLLNEGYIVVYNSSGTEIGRWDKNGIDVQAGTISGANIVVGGNNNVNGTITVKDANGNTVGTWTKDGLNVTSGTLTGATINGGHIYGSYYGSRTANNFFIIAEDNTTVVGVPGFEFKNKIMSTDWIGSIGNPALNDDDMAGINGNNGKAGFRDVYILDSWFSGGSGPRESGSHLWGLAETIIWLDGRVSALEQSCLSDCSDYDDSCDGGGCTFCSSDSTCQEICIDYSQCDGCTESDNEADWEVCPTE